MAEESTDYELDAEPEGDEQDDQDAEPTEGEEAEPEGEDGQEADEDEEGEEGEERDGAPLPPDVQAKLDRAMSKKTAMHYKKLREVEARAEAAERRAEEFAKYAPQQQAPEVPEPPDPYADDYDQQMERYRASIAQRAQWEVLERDRLTQQQRQQALDAQRELEQRNKTVAEYAARSAKLGIKQTELQKAALALQDYGIDMRLAQRIVKEDYGPGITLYLSKNPQVLADLHAMPYEDAVVTLATTVKEAAKAARQARTPPPDPVRRDRGTGLREREMGPEGATYE